MQEFCLLTFPFLEGTCLLFLFVIGWVCVPDLKGDWLGRSVSVRLTVGWFGCSRLLTHFYSSICMLG